MADEKIGAGKTLKDIEQDGVNAYWNDISFHECPYLFGGKESFVYGSNDSKPGYEHEFDAWKRGWNKAEREVIKDYKK